MQITKEVDLVKEQMKIIDKLQEKIKLLQFDVSENLKEIKILKEKIKRKNTNIKNMRIRLIKMKKTNDFSDINKILFAMSNDGENNE